VAQLSNSLLLASQGPSGRLFVHDQNPDNGVRHDCTAAPDPLQGGLPRPIAFVPIPEACCLAVREFCGLPLCAATQSTDGLWIRENTGQGCVPFLMPAACCPD
jgi:hypothetical protein